MIATLEPQAPTKEPLQDRISATRLNTWLGCRLRFFFRYVQGLTKPKTAATYVGHAVHAVLRHWNLARWRKENAGAEVLRNELDRVWTEDQKKEPVQWEPGEESGGKDTAWALVDLYLRQTPIPADEMPEGVEVTVEADLKAHGLPRLIGILDLVRAGGRIVDFKTTGQTPSHEWAAHQNEVQMSAYAVLYREATGRKEAGLELHQLVKLKAPKLVVTELGPMSERQQTRLFRQMESFVTGVERQDFVPSPGLHCVTCPYSCECREWS
jgi:RecB family exonuclease